MKKIDVWYGEECKEFSIEEFKDSFKFTYEPNYNEIDEVFVYDNWIKIVFEDCYGRRDVETYNSVYGTYLVNPS